MGGEGPGLTGTGELETRRRSPSPSYGGLSRAEDNAYDAIKADEKRRLEPDNIYKPKWKNDLLLHDRPFWFLLSDQIYTHWQHKRSQEEGKQSRLNRTADKGALPPQYQDPPLAVVKGIVAVNIGQRQFLLKAQVPQQSAKLRAIKLYNASEVQKLVQDWSLGFIYDVDTTRRMNWAALTAEASDVEIVDSDNNSALVLNVRDFSYMFRSWFYHWQNKELQLDFPLMYFIPNSYDAMLGYLNLDNQGNVIKGQKEPCKDSRAVIDARARAFVVHKRGFSTKTDTYKRFSNKQKREVIMENALQAWTEPNPNFEDGEYYCYAPVSSFDWIVPGRAIQVYSQDEETRLLQAAGDNFTSMPGHICLDPEVQNEYGHYEGVKVPAKIIYLKPLQLSYTTKPHWTWSSAVKDRNLRYRQNFDMYFPFRRRFFEPCYFFVYDSFIDGLQTNGSGSSSISSSNNQAQIRQIITQLLGLDMNTNKLKPSTLHNFKMSIYPSPDWSHGSDSYQNPLKRHAFILPCKGQVVQGIALWVETEAVADVLNSYYPEQLQTCQYRVEIQIQQENGADREQSTTAGFARFFHPHTTDERCLAERAGKKYLFTREEILRRGRR